MRRVLPPIAAAVLIGTGAQAHADWAQRIDAMRARLPAIDNPPKQRELELLLAKARGDNDAGHAKLCADDLPHAQQLVK